jgi:hypothetical protein
MPSSMGDASHSAPGRSNSETRGYEIRDANPAALLGFLALLFLVLAATLFGTWLVFRYFAFAGREPNPGSSFANVRQVPPGPELQVDPREDLLKAYAEQQQLLENYSWADRKSGAVRIPIERAMDLLVQRGVPVLSPATVEKSNGEEKTSGNSAAGSSNGVAGESTK